MQLAHAAASFRRNTEDRFEVHEERGRVVVVVADGAGGIPGGRAAAEMAMERVREALYGRDVHDFTGLLMQLDAAIVMGESTLVIASVADDGRIVGASVGDSGALLVDREGNVTDLTAGQHRKRRLGSRDALPVAFEGQLDGGTLLVATDGLLAHARPEVLAEVLRAHDDDLDAAANALIERVRLPSGTLQDDVALVLVRA